MGMWYAHRLTTTFILSQLPPGWPKRPEDAPYFPEGWLRGKGCPSFERAASGQVKRAESSSWRRIVDPDLAVVGLDSAREAPMHPRAFAARLGRVIFTNGKSDCELVAGLYADTLAGAFGHAQVLQYRNCAWTDDDACALAAALPFAKRVREVDLFGNAKIGQRGLDALAKAIRAGAAPALEQFKFDFRWGARAAGLRAACKARNIEVEVV